MNIQSRWLSLVLLVFAFSALSAFDQGSEQKNAFRTEIQSASFRADAQKLVKFNSNQEELIVPQTSPDNNHSRQITITDNYEGESGNVNFGTLEKDKSSQSGYGNTGDDKSFAEDQADLTVPQITWQSDQVSEGQTFWVRAIIKNIGGGTAGPSHTRLYLSIDNDYSVTGDIDLGEKPVPALAPNQEIVVQWDIANFPDANKGSSSTGTYPAWFLVRVDSRNEVTETNEKNLFKSSKSIAVNEGACLTVGIPNGKETWALGSEHTISWHEGMAGANVRLDYTIDDGISWNPIIASTPNDGFHKWQLPQTPANAAKVRVMSLSNTACFDLSDEPFRIGTCPVPYIASSDVSAGAGSQVTVSISIHGNTTPVDAFGFDLIYNPDHLSYVEIKKGGLTTNWMYLNGNLLSPGTIRVGGFHTTAIPTGSQGTIVDIVLNVTCLNCLNEKSQSQLKIGQLTDDLVGMNISTGVFQFGAPCDLVMSQITWQSDQVSEGQPFWVKATIRNIGPGTAGASYARLYLSTDNDYSVTGDIDLGEKQVPALLANQDTVLQWDIANFPDANKGVSSTGTYPAWFLVRVDSRNEVTETNEKNLFKSSKSITVNEGACLLEVIIPNGKETWALGSEHTISWHEGMAGANVRLDYTIDDGISWNPIIASTPNDGFHKWQLPQTPANAAKVRVMSLSNTACFDLSDEPFRIGTCPAPYIASSDVSAGTGSQVTVSISIHGNTTPVDAFGFDLIYNPDHLSYVEIKKGGLTTNWMYINGNLLSPGTIRVGGFHTAAIPTGSHGTIVDIVLNVTCPNCLNEKSQSQLKISQLTDDLVGMNISTGVFQFGALCDLVMSQITWQSDQVIEGNPFWVRATIKNTSNGSAGPSHTRLYLSIDNDYSVTGDIDLGEKPVPALAPNQETVVQWDIASFPNANQGVSSTGTYPAWFLIRVDSRNELTETNEKNLYKSSKSITVTDARLMKSSHDQIAGLSADHFDLAQNHPNPFNMATEIYFNLPEATEVRLEVFDMLGRSVCTLVSDRLDAGVHKIVWDGKNSQDETLSSGVYFAQLYAGQEIRTIKMIMVK